MYKGNNQPTSSHLHQIESNPIGAIGAIRVQLGKPALL